MEDARVDFNVINYSFNYYSWTLKETGLIHLKKIPKWKFGNIYQFWRMRLKERNRAWFISEPLWPIDYEPYPLGIYSNITVNMKFRILFYVGCHWVIFLRLIEAVKPYQYSLTWWHRCALILEKSKSLCWTAKKYLTLIKFPKNQRLRRIRAKKRF